MMTASPFMRTVKGGQKKIPAGAGKDEKRTPVPSPLHLFGTRVKHGHYLKGAQFVRKVGGAEMYIQS